MPITHEGCLELCLPVVKWECLGGNGNSCLLCLHLFRDLQQYCAAAGSHPIGITQTVSRQMLFFLFRNQEWLLTTFNL